MFFLSGVLREIFDYWLVISKNDHGRVVDAGFRVLSTCEHGLAYLSHNPSFDSW